jgi:dTMP kinase
MDIDPEEGLRRRSGAGNLNGIDRRELEFHRRVREGFLALADAEPARWLVLDGTREPAELVAAIADRLTAFSAAR